MMKLWEAPSLIMNLIVLSDISSICGKSYSIYKLFLSHYLHTKAIYQQEYKRF